MVPKSQRKLKNDQNWIHTGDDWNVEPPDNSYVHGTACYNCGKQNSYYIRKGVPTGNAKPECERCGVIVTEPIERFLARPT